MGTRARVEINSEPNKRLRLTPPLASRGEAWEGYSHFMKSECGVWARVEINSEPNKELRLTSPLASREAGMGIGLEGYQKLALGAQNKGAGKNPRFRGVAPPAPPRK